MKFRSFAILVQVACVLLVSSAWALDVDLETRQVAAAETAVQVSCNQNGNQPGNHLGQAGQGERIKEGINLGRAEMMKFVGFETQKQMDRLAKAYKVEFLELVKRRPKSAENQDLSAFNTQQDISRKLELKMQQLAILSDRSPLRGGESRRSLQNEILKLKADLQKSRVPASVGEFKSLDYAGIQKIAELTERAGKVVAKAYGCFAIAASETESDLAAINQSYEARGKIKDSDLKLNPRASEALGEMAKAASAGR